MEGAGLRLPPPLAAQPIGGGARPHVRRPRPGSWQNVNEKEERDLKVLAAPAEDKCASFARSPAARRRLRTAGRTDGRSRAAEATRTGSYPQAAGSGSNGSSGSTSPRSPGALSAPGSTTSPRVPPATAGHAAGPGLRGRGVCSPATAPPLPDCAPGARRASWRRRGAGTFRLSLASPERVYERSVPAVADDDAAPAGE